MNIPKWKKYWKIIQKKNAAKNKEKLVYGRKFLVQFDAEFSESIPEEGKKLSVPIHEINYDDDEIWNVYIRVSSNA